MIVGIGTDIIEITRIKAAIIQRPRLQERLFTVGELQYCFRKPNPWPSLAARFAAKEAIMKALGVGLWVCGFQEMEVVKKQEGPPFIRLDGKALVLAQGQGINHWHLSLSHNKTEAVAFVLAEKRTGEPGKEGEDVPSQQGGNGMA